LDKLMLQSVGTHYPLRDEQDIFNAISDSLRSILLDKDSKL
jgi:hypothetical protein